jgi:hypothetical protein
MRRDHGLEWTDVDFAKRQLTVARSEWKGQVTMPKGGTNQPFLCAFQRRTIARNQRVLLRARPSLQLPFASERFITGSMHLREHQANQPSAGGK